MGKLKIGDPAPAFTGTDQNGGMLSPADFIGRKLILYFYPKDDTPGCTDEACSLRDGRNDLREMGFEVVGVSPDSESSHRKFIGKNNLNFPLLADTDRAIAQAYGVWGEKKFMGRTYGRLAHHFRDRRKRHCREDFRQSEYQRSF